MNIKKIGIGFGVAAALAAAGYGIKTLFFSSKGNEAAPAEQQPAAPAIEAPAEETK